MSQKNLRDSGQANGQYLLFMKQRQDFEQNLGSQNLSRNQISGPRLNPAYTNKVSSQDGTPKDFSQDSQRLKENNSLYSNDARDAMQQNSQRVLKSGSNQKPSPYIFSDLVTDEFRDDRKASENLRPQIIEPSYDHKKPHQSAPQRHPEYFQGQEINTDYAPRRYPENQILGVTMNRDDLYSSIKKQMRETPSNGKAYPYSSRLSNEGIVIDGKLASPQKMRIFQTLPYTQNTQFSPRDSLQLRLGLNEMTTGRKSSVRNSQKINNLIEPENPPQRTSNQPNSSKTTSNRLIQGSQSATPNRVVSVHADGSTSIVKRQIFTPSSQRHSVARPASIDMPEEKYHIQNNSNRHSPGFKTQYSSEDYGSMDCRVIDVRAYYGQDVVLSTKVGEKRLVSEHRGEPVLVETIRKDPKVISQRDIRTEDAHKNFAGENSPSIKGARNEEIIVEGMQRVMSLTKENQRLQQTNAGLEHEAYHLRQQVNSSRVQQDSIESLRAEISRLTQDNLKLKGYFQQVQMLHKDKSALETGNQMLSSENESLRSELKQVKSREGSFLDINRKIALLAQENERMIRAREDLQTQLENVYKQNQDLQDAFASQKAENQRLVTQNERLTKTKSEFELEMHELKTHISEFDKFLAQKETQTELRIADLNKALNALELDSKKKSEDIKEYKLLLRQTQAENLKISQKFQEGEAKLERLQKQLEESEQSQEQNKSDLKSKITILAIENDTLTRLLDTVKKESQVNDQTRGRLELAQQTIQQLTEQNKELISSLNHTREALLRAENEGQEYRVLTEKLEKELNVHRTSSDESKVQLHKLRLTLESKVEDCVQQLLDKFTDIETEFAKKTEKLVMAEESSLELLKKRDQEVTNLKNINNNLLKVNSAHECKFKDMRHELQMKTIEIEENYQKLKHTLLEAKNFQEKLVEYEKENFELKESCNILQGQLRSSEEALDKRDNLIEELNAKLKQTLRENQDTTSSLSQALEALELENSELKKTVDNLEASLDDKIERLTLVESQNQVLLTECQELKSNYESIKNQLYNMELALIDQMNNIEDLKVDKEDLSNQLESRTKKCTSLEAELLSGQNQVIELSQQLTKVKSQLESTISTLEMANSEKETVLENYGQAKLSLEECQSRLKFYEEEISALKNEAQRSQHELEILNSELNSVKADLTEKNSQVERLNCDLDQLNLALEQKENDLKACESKIVDLNLNLNTLEKANLVLQNEMESHKIKALQDIQTLEMQLQKKSDSLSENFQALENSLGDLKTQNLNYLGEIEHLRSDIESRNQIIDEKAAEISELESRLKDSSQLISNYKINYESLEGEYIFLKEKLSSQDAKLQELMQDSKAQQILHQEQIAAHNQSYSILKDESNRLRDIIEILKLGSMQDAEELNSSLEQQHENILNLQTQVSDLLKEQSVLLQQISTIQDQNQSKNEEIARLKDTNLEVEGERQTVLNLYEKSTEQVKKLAADLEQSQKALTEEKAHIVCLQSAKDLLDESLEEAKQIVKDLNQKNSELTKELEILMIDFDSEKKTRAEQESLMRDQISKLHAVLEEHKISHSELVNLMESEKSHSQKQIQDLTTKLLDITSQFESSSAQLQQQKSANLILQGQIDNLSLQFDGELQQKNHFERLYEEERRKRGELEIKFNAASSELIHLDSSYKQLELESKQIVDDWTKERQKFLETNQRLDFVNKDRLKDIEKKSWENGKLLIKLALSYAELERIAKFKRGDFSRTESLNDANETSTDQCIKISQSEHKDTAKTLGEEMLSQTGSEPKAIIEQSIDDPEPQDLISEEKQIPFDETLESVATELEASEIPDYSMIDSSQVQFTDVDVEEELKMVVESLDQEIMQMIGKVGPISASRISELHNSPKQKLLNSQPTNR